MWPTYVKRPKLRRNPERQRWCSVPPRAATCAPVRTDPPFPSAPPPQCEKASISKPPSPYNFRVIPTSPPRRSRLPPAQPCAQVGELPPNSNLNPRDPPDPSSPACFSESGHPTNPLFSSHIGRPSTFPATTITATVLSLFKICFGSTPRTGRPPSQHSATHTQAGSFPTNKSSDRTSDPR